MTRRGVMAGLLTALAAANCGRPDLPPPPPSEITDFHLLFRDNCSGCHGADGRNSAAPELNNPEYLSIVPRDAIAQTITTGRPGTPMPAFARSQGGPLYPDQITALVDGIENNWAKPVNLNGTPPPYSAPEGDAAAGAQVFASVCALCHGPKGKAGPLTDQSYLALVSDQGLRTTIIVGKPSLGMPDWRHQMIPGGLSNQDISNVVAFLSSLRSPLTEARRQSESGHESNAGNMSSETGSVQGGPGQSNKNATPQEHQ